MAKTRVLMPLTRHPTFRAPNSKFIVDVAAERLKSYASFRHREINRGVFPCPAELGARRGRQFRRWRRDRNRAGARECVTKRRAERSGLSSRAPQAARGISRSLFFHLSGESSLGRGPPSRRQVLLTTVLYY